MRPGWDEYFMGIVEAVSMRSTCGRGRVGCVIAREGRLVCSGYSGSPPGLPHCDEAGHLFNYSVLGEADKVFNPEDVTQHCVRTVHAEQNAIAHAARHGIALEGCTLYCTMTPCFFCAKIIVSAGIKRVVAGQIYHADKFSRQVLDDAGIELCIINKTTKEYEDG